MFYIIYCHENIVFIVIVIRGNLLISNCFENDLNNHVKVFSSSNYKIEPLILGCDQIDNTIYPK